MLAIDIISATMKCLKDKMIAEFNKADFAAKESDIQWVITVPAIWKASAKQLMRKAAYQVSMTLCLLWLPNLQVETSL